MVAKTLKNADIVRKRGRPPGKTKAKTPDEMRAYKAAKQREYRAKWKRRDNDDQD